VICFPSLVAMLHLATSSMRADNAHAGRGFTWLLHAGCDSGAKSSSWVEPAASSMHQQSPIGTQAAACSSHKSLHTHHRSTRMQNAKRQERCLTASVSRCRWHYSTQPYRSPNLRSSCCYCCCWAQLYQPRVCWVDQPLPQAVEAGLLPAGAAHGACCEGHAAAVDRQGLERVVADGLLTCSRLTRSWQSSIHSCLLDVQMLKLLCTMCMCDCVVCAAWHGKLLQVLGVCLQPAPRARAPGAD
jgi:hypothetical protein